MITVDQSRKTLLDHIKEGIERLEGRVFGVGHDRLLEGPKR
jgi:hypothetical protein